MAWQETLNERQALAMGTPATLNGTSCTTLGIWMGGLRRARAYCNIGAITSSGSINFSLQASATATGVYTAITNNTTNPTITGIVTANALNCIEIRADQMPPGKPYLRAIATETASQNVVCDVILIGDESEYKPGNQYNNAGTLTNNVVVA